MKIVNLVLFSSLLFISCQKSDNVTGRVTNYYTGEPISGLQVSITNYKSGLLAGEEGSTSSELTDTDNSGNFNFYLLAKGRKGKKGKHHLKCNYYNQQSNKDYEISYYTSFPSSYTIDDEKKQNADFKLVTSTRIKFLLNKVREYMPGDSLSVSAFDSFYSLPVLTYPGNHNNFTTSYLNIPSNGLVFLKCYSRRGNIVKEYLDTLNIKPFLKTDYVINWE